jgi:glycyl-tRNA synthetase beta subunit
MATQDFLVELGTEELPPKALSSPSLTLSPRALSKAWKKPA